MKVQLFISPKQNHSKMKMKYLAMIREVMSNREADIELTEQFPDIIHVLGIWDLQATQQITSAHNLNIPTILSTMGGMTPWQISHSRSLAAHNDWVKQKKTVQQSSAVIVWGNTERMEIEKRRLNEQVHLIPNALITSSISPIKMGDQIIRLYDEIIKRHDLQIHTSIDKELNALGENNEIEKQVCHQFLYLQYQFHRQNIHSQTIEQLKQTLLTVEYNEDILKSMLEQLHQNLFASRLMQLMAEDYNLTQGFMPLDPLEDKLSKQLKAFVRSI